MKILIVENEVIVADNIQIVLQKQGYDVLEPALNYEQALISIAQDQPGFIILDINLGKGKSGIDVANYLKKNHDIPFIFLTAYSDPDTLKNAMDSHPSGYLIKPFAKSEIKPSIEVALINFKLRKKEIRTNIMDSLTPMEIALIKLIAEKKTANEIAETLNLAKGTVKNYRHRICEKLNLPSGNNSLLSWVLLHHEQLNTI
jgi:DNA-binding NarL/FixJ family response regulator